MNDANELKTLQSSVAHLEAQVAQLRKAGERDGVVSFTRARRGQRWGMLLGTLGLCALPVLSWAAVSLTEFQAGDPIVAADVNDNFAAVAAAVNAGQRLEVSPLETLLQCTSSTLCLSDNLEVAITTDGTRAVRVELVHGAPDAYISLDLGPGGQTDCQAELVIQRSTDGGDWNEVYRPTLRYIEPQAGPSVLGVPLGVVHLIDRDAGAGTHTYRFGMRVPIDDAASVSVGNARLAVSDAGELAR